MNMEIEKGSVNVHQYYGNKTVFLTGCTGFIGKVILEKLLWCFPDINAIYLLIRGKERFYDNVIKSACFTRLRQRHQQNFNKFIDEKCHLVEGDMTMDQLGISTQKEEEIINKVQIVINSAASIDFTADLDVNIEINVFGGMRVFELAKKAKNLENFLHISTAYSNSNIKGEIEEKVYPIADDPLKLIQEILSLPKELIVKHTKKYIGKYPNTYTYTKNLFEQILYKEKGKYPIVILRPTIVGAAYREPMKGWTDAISAAGALFLLGGLGLLSFVPGNEDVVLDQIPVDFVVDYVIVAAAVYAKNTLFNIVHCGTSFKNPFKFIWLNDEIWEYWKQNPSSKQILPPRFSVITTPWIYKLKNIKRMAEYYSYIWFLKRFGNVEQKKQLTRFQKMVDREKKVCKEFEYFLTIDFVFKMYNCQYLQDCIINQEKNQFLLDTQIIDWKEYLQNFCHGIQVNILKEDVLQPDDISQRNALKQNPLKPRDIENYLLPEEQFKSKNVGKIIDEILKKEEISNKMRMLSSSEYKHVQSMCKQMFADYNFDILKRLARPMQKQFKRVFSQIIVDESKINQLRVAEKNGKRLVIVSNHVSYADFVILTYIFYAYSLKCPFVNSSHAFLGIPLLTQIFRYGGAFFTECKRKQYSEMYSLILGEYMQMLIAEGANIEFFIETSRSRSGKLTPANNAAFDLFIQGALNQPNAKDILIVPVNVSYEKVIEQDAFTFELLGEEKPKEGIWRLLKWASTQISHCGRVYLQIADPVPIHQMYPVLPPCHQPLMHSIANLSVIMPTSIVAAIILLSRNGISSTNLTAQADWLCNQLHKRSVKIASISSSSPLISVTKAVSFFDDIMIKNKDIFTIAVKPKQEYKAILLLAYYRNALLNQLFQEAKAASALFALNRISTSITSHQFNSRFQFLDSLFQYQFIDTQKESQQEQQQQLSQEQKPIIIQKMLSFQTILQNQNQDIECKDHQFISFLNSLILPFIESYWCAFLSLQSIKNQNQARTKQQIIEQMQWLAEQLFDEKILANYESCSLDSLKQAFKTFKVKYNTIHYKLIKAKQMIQKDRQTKLYTLVMEDEEYIEYEKQIRFYLTNQENTSTNPFEIAKLVLGEFPIVSKL